MHSIQLRLLAATAAVSLVASAYAAPVADPAYADDLHKWRTRADESLKRERGWLSIVTRDELSPGSYRIGSAPDNQVVLPKALSPCASGHDHRRATTRRGCARGPADAHRREGRRRRGVRLPRSRHRRDPAGMGDVRAPFAAIRQARRWQGRRARRRSRFAAAQDLRGPCLVRAEDGVQGAGGVRPHAQGATIPIANVRGEISYEKVAGTLEFSVNGQKLSWTRSTTKARSSSSFAMAPAARRRTRPDGSWWSKSPGTGTGSSTSTRRSTRPVRSPPTRHARCRRRRTGSRTTFLPARSTPDGSPDARSGATSPDLRARARVRVVRHLPASSVSRGGVFAVAAVHDTVIVPPTSGLAWSWGHRVVRVEREIQCEDGSCRVVGLVGGQVGLRIEHSERGRNGEDPEKPRPSERVTMFGVSGDGQSASPRLPSWCRRRHEAAGPDRTGPDAARRSKVADRPALSCTPRS